MVRRFRLRDHRSQPGEEELLWETVLQELKGMGLSARPEPAHPTHSGRFPDVLVIEGNSPDITNQLTLVLLQLGLAPKISYTPIPEKLP